MHTNDISNSQYTATDVRKSMYSFQKTITNTFILFFSCVLYLSSLTTYSWSNENEVTSTINENKTNGNYSKKDLLKHLQKRINLLETCRFKIEIKHECNPYYAITAFSPDPGLLIKFQKDKPELLEQLKGNSPLVINQTKELFAHDEKIKFIRSGEQIRQGKFPIELGKYYQLDVTNTKKSVSYFDFNWSNGMKSGHINNHTFCAGVLDHDTLPIRSWIAPGAAHISRDFDVRSFNFSESSLKKGNENTVELYHNNGSETVTCDPSRGYVVTNWKITGSSNEPTRILDISYSYDQQHEIWVPEKWNHILFMQDQVVGLSSSSTVVEYELNPTFKDDEFDFSFPVGTVVSDMNPTAKGYDQSTSSANYLIKNDDQIRPIYGNEKFMSYEKLKNTEPGEVPAGPSGESKDNHNYSLLFLANSLFISLGVLLFILKKRK